MAEAIARARVERLALPFHRRYVTAAGAIERRELALLRLETRSGLVGLGESAAMSLRGGPDSEAIARDLLEICAPALLGLDAATLAVRLDDGSHSLAGIRDALRACELAGAGRQALCAVDLALHDLAGHMTRSPVHALLGAARAAVAVNATLTAAEPGQLVEQSSGWLEDGFTSFKLKVGHAGDVAGVAAVREAVGDEAVLTVDANGAWDLATAASRLGEMSAAGLRLAEQPVAGLDGLAALARLVDVGLAADESVVTTADAELAAEAGLAATVKLSKCGGIQAALAVARGVPSWVSSALDGPVGIAAGAHLALAITTRGRAPGEHGLATQRLFAIWPARTGAELVGARLRPAPMPGLGVELDEDAVAELRLGATDVGEGEVA